MDSKQAYDKNGQDMLIEEKGTTVLTPDGVSIFVHAWVPDNPHRVLVCVQGLGGHGAYDSELASCVAVSGTIVVAPDLRGHGLSEGTRGDIDRFDLYVLDVDAVFTWIEKMWPDKLIFMLGESMGASITIQYVACRAVKTHQKPLTGLVLVSPVFSSTLRPSFGEIVHFVYSLLIAPTYPSIVVTGREELGCREPDFNALLRADPLFVRLVSVRFLIRLTMWLKQSKRKASQINLPLLVFLAGRDKIAQHSSTSVFLSKVPARERRIVTFPQAFHCLLRDPDTPDVIGILNAWLAGHNRE